MRKFLYYLLRSSVITVTKSRRVVSVGRETNTWKMTNTNKIPDGNCQLEMTWN